MFWFGRFSLSSSIKLTVLQARLPPSQALRHGQTVVVAGLSPRGPGANGEPTAFLLQTGLSPVFPPGVWWNSDRFSWALMLPSNSGTAWDCWDYYQPEKSQAGGGLEEGEGGGVWLSSKRRLVSVSTVRNPSEANAMMEDRAAGLNCDWSDVAELLCFTLCSRFHDTIPEIVVAWLRLSLWHFLETWRH